MTYAGLGTVNATNDLSNILVYANDLTGGVLMPMMLGAFFVVVLLGGYFMQLRFSGRARIDLCFASAGFSTVGMAVLMSLKNGLLNPIYLFLSIIVAIIGVAWLYFSQE